MEQRLGPAAESLQALLDEGHAESYDLAFIGAPLLCLHMHAGVANGKPAALVRQRA